MTAFTALPFGMIGNRRGVPALQRQAPMLNQQPYQQPVSMADAPVAAPAMPTTQMRSTGVTTEPVKQPKPAPRKRGGMFSGGRGLMLLGAGLRDMDGTMGSNNFNTMLSYVTEQQEEERLRMEKEAREAAMLAAMPNLTPEQRALFAANPSGVFDAATEMAFRAPSQRRIVEGADGRQYYTDTGELVLPNVTPKADPTTLKVVQMDGAQGFGTYVFDPSDPTSAPRFVGSQRRDIKTEEMVVNGKPGIYDVSDPQNPVFLGEIVPDEDGPGLSDVTALRKEFLGITDDYRSVNDQYGILVSAGTGQPSAQKDLALVVAFTKLLDPGSVAREGEVTLSQSTQSAVARAGNTLERLKQGQTVLDPVARQGFVNAAKEMMQVYTDAYDRRKQEYSDFATRYNIDPQDVIFGAPISYNFGASADPNNPNGLPLQ